MTDLRLNADGDLAYVDGDCQVVGRRGDEQSERDEIVQRLGVLLRTHRGEWPFDILSGVDYRGIIFADNATIEATRSHLIAVATSGFRINRVLEMDVTIDGRLVRAKGSVDTDLGALPFDVETEI